MADAIEASRQRRILFTACLGAFMATLDSSIVNIALPQIAHDFQASLSQISWIMASYLLASVSLLLPFGRLGDLLAPGRLFLLGLVIFTAGSALCGFSPNLSWMISSRAVQAVGASLMLSLAPKLIATTFDEKGRGFALGLFSTAFATGVSVGAPLGGIITGWLGWPYIYFINIPVCLLALLAGSRPLIRIEAQNEWNRKDFDIWGSVVLAGSLVSFLLALNWVKTSPLSDPWTSGAFVFSAALFALLLFLERRCPAPILHGELWQSPPFLLGSAVVVLTFAAALGAFFLMPFFLGRIYGYSTGQTGFLLACWSITNALVAALGGFLADRFGNLLVLRTGAGLLLAGLASFLLTSPESSTLGLIGRFVLIGAGFGLFQAPNLNEILRGTKPSLVGLAASANSVLKNLGALLGITMMVMVFASIKLHHLALTPQTPLGIDAFHTAFTAAVAVAAVNLLMNLLPRSAPRPGETTA